MPPSKGQTKPRQFRLTDEELELLDRIAALKQAEDGVKRTRTDAIRMAARHFGEFLGVTPKPKPKK
jgi:hypothetical protein